MQLAQNDLVSIAGVGFRADACEFTGKPTPRATECASVVVADLLDRAGRALLTDWGCARDLATQVVTLLDRAVPHDVPARAAAPRRETSNPGKACLAAWQITRLENHIRAHLSGSILIEDLAALVHQSVGYFCRTFKRSFGESPHGHVVRLRLEMAQRLITQTDQRLIDIAIACGFSDQAHLCKMFRKHAGCSPGAWRRRTTHAAALRTAA